ncbi:DUF4232 domain-containing protein [Streptomyces sp. NBC_01217]|uniref:DUF4232 domain-containing protein n=1 Tax=Streptomyces sp. NBC_01217 TaxID=2903779 RepID=UPI002E0FC129|nr:DUF4232 domain-containing protein [Streptomyces sp. NBC_01217]
MRCTTRNGVTKASSVLLVVAALTGSLLAGAGSGAAAQGAASRRVPVAPCTNDRLVADGAQRVGSSQVRITVSNEGPTPCVLMGFPTVALAGQGPPDRNKPLDAVRQGTAEPVRLAVGGRASTQLSFTPVLGEADGYCASGATPSIAPSIVLGVGGAGQQLAPDDGGGFALCGNSVRVTAFRAAGS